MSDADTQHPTTMIHNNLSAVPASGTAHPLSPMGELFASIGQLGKEKEALKTAVREAMALLQAKPEPSVNRAFLVLKWPENTQPRLA